MSDLTIREGSLEDILFYFTRGDDEVDIGTDEVIMRRRSGTKADDHFSTEDASPILTVTDASGGEVTLAPVAATWAGLSARWEYEIYFEIGPEDGEHLVYPEDSNLTVKIIPKYV